MMPTSTPTAEVCDSEEPPQKRLCILKREVSDDLHLENSLEQMAVKVREAFESNNFHSEDSASPECSHAIWR